MEKVRILIVEDEILVAKDIQSTLFNLGYSDIDIAADGGESFACIEKNQPDLILMDIMLMGEHDGIEIAHKIQETYNLPIIYISALSDDTTLERAKKTLPYGYIIKPFKERELLSTIEMALHKFSMENKLRESEDKFRTLFEKAAYPAFLMDNETIIECNKAAVVFLEGDNKKAIIGKSFLDFSPEIQPDGTPSGKKAKEMISIAHEKGAYQFEWHNKTAKGKFIPAEVMLTSITLYGEIILHVVIRDITQQKLAEENLIKNEEQYRNLFEEDLTGNFIADSNGNLIACNPTFSTIFGFDSTRSAMDINLSALFPDHSGWDNLRNLLQNEKKLVYHEIELNSIEGSPVYVVGNFIGNFNGEGRITGLQGYIFDDTERKKLKQQFLQSQKMEAIGRLAGGIAHDFNNILTIINGFSEILFSSIEEDHPSMEAVKEIKLAGERASLLVKQLLVFSSRQIMQPQIVNLNSVISSIDTLLKRLIIENIELTILLDPRLGMAEIDPVQMEQVIMNLVVNARDSMPQGGALVIQTRNLDVTNANQHLYPILDPGPFVVLSVSDTGTGIEESVQQHILEPFFTTKKKGEGTGLGLSTVYGIITQSKGCLDFSSTVGRGTTFYIYLPRILREVVTENANEEKPYTARGDEKILVVEDDDSVRNFVCQILTSNGYRAIPSRNGKEALELSQQFEEPVSLIISDIIMPGINGPEMVKKIRVSRPETKVLFISGYTYEYIQNQSLEENSYFIQKPFKPEELIRTVRFILDS